MMPREGHVVVVVLLYISVFASLILSGEGFISWYVPSRRSVTLCNAAKRKKAKRKTRDGVPKPSFGGTNPAPRLIVFDLDGCLWKPELYELAWRGEQSPFKALRRSDGTSTSCISRTGMELRLIRDVPTILERIYQHMRETTRMCISSRTGKAQWARELLSLLRLPQSQVSLEEALSGPWEIKNEPKREHFLRISEKTGIDPKEMVFFDNERGNCQKVAKLGVTVGYCPEGLTDEIFNRTLSFYPRTNWDVVGVDL